MSVCEIVKKEGALIKSTPAKKLPEFWTGALDWNANSVQGWFIGTSYKP
jgi:hypothetical protein